MNHLAWLWATLWACGAPGEEREELYLLTDAVQEVRIDASLGGVVVVEAAAEGLALSARVRDPGATVDLLQEDGRLVVSTRCAHEGPCRIDYTLAVSPEVRVRVGSSTRDCRIEDCDDSGEIGLVGLSSGALRHGDTCPC